MNKKSVLVTGSSRGIGRACAIAFAKAGYHVFINCRQNIALLHSLQDEVNKTLLHDEYYYPTDERTIQECLEGDYILLGVYNDVGVKSPRL